MSSNWGIDSSGLEPLIWGRLDAPADNPAVI
jgi:hypothetical protein